ncbi:hypothetical protein HHK36_004210 [Tetracentron sinense]|uniref:Uncharacterized protein n=1 Tax=Tetracentron sinense TaxID=13715 RepID=A0A834ZZY6_TETSI|nr:hypothetical protein HHK36_004210 [Tetracentron sinense]
MKYKGKGNIREYIMEMSHLASKLKSLKLELSEDLLLHLVLISLPAHFGQFKVSYNTQKDKWSLNELISHCVQEEERQQRDKTESAHLASTSQNEKRKKAKEKDGTWPLEVSRRQQDGRYRDCSGADTSVHAAVLWRGQVVAVVGELKRAMEMHSVVAVVAARDGHERRGRIILNMYGKKIRNIIGISDKSALVRNPSVNDINNLTTLHR